MSTTASSDVTSIEYGWAGAALEDDISGDAHVVVQRGDHVVIAVLDGLGHGPDAAAAARAGVEVIAGSTLVQPIALVRAVHDGLRRTRGAVMSVAVIDAVTSTMSWTGVGNVEGVLVRCDAARGHDALGTRGGVVGFQLPPLRATTVELGRGDVLVFATDGIRAGFSGAIVPEYEPQAIADGLLASHARGTDDALVLVARYRGGAG